MLLFAFIYIIFGSSILQDCSFLFFIFILKLNSSIFQLEENYSFLQYQLENFNSVNYT